MRTWWAIRCRPTITVDRFEPVRATFISLLSCGCFSGCLCLGLAEVALGLGLAWGGLIAQLG